MKRIFASLFAFMFLLTGVVSLAQAITQDEYRVKVQEFRKGMFSADDLVRLSQQVANSMAQSDPAFARVALSGAWEALILKGDAQSAMDVAEYSIQTYPESGHGYMLKSDVWALMVEKEHAIQALKDGIAHATEQAEQAKMQERIAGMDYRINFFVPLWADFAEQPEFSQKLYAGKLAHGRGIITEISKNGADTVLFFQSNSLEPIGIECHFNASVPDLANLKVGDGIYYVGECEGLKDKRVILRNCTLDEDPD